jgi:hypothetical protein
MIAHPQWQSRLRQGCHAGRAILVPADFVPNLGTTAAAFCRNRGGRSRCAARDAGRLGARRLRGLEPRDVAPSLQTRP